MDTDMPSGTIEYPVTVYYADDDEIYRGQEAHGALQWGEPRDDAHTLDDLLRTPRTWQREIERGKRVWMYDERWGRNTTAHRILVRRDRRRHADQGVYTSAGLYGTRASGGTGIPNDRLAKALRRHKPRITSRPQYLRKVIHTDWGYVVPRTTYEFVDDYVRSGDLVGALRRRHFMSYDKAIRKGNGHELVVAEKKLGTPSALRLFYDKISEALPDVDISVRWLIEEMKREVTETDPGSRGRLTAIEKLMALVKSHAIAMDALTDDARVASFADTSNGQAVVFTKAELETLAAVAAGGPNAQL